MKRDAKRLKGAILFVVFVSIIILMLSILTGSFAQKGPLRLTTAATSVGSPPYVVVSNFAEAAKRGLPPGSSINVESLGTTANAARIGEGELDFGYVNMIDVALATKGKPPFTKKYEKIRMLCGIFPPGAEEYLFMVEKGTGLNSIDEIKQKRYPLTLAIPMKGSGSELLTRMVLGAYGITYDDITSWGGKVIFTSFTEQRALFKDRRVQATASIMPYPHPGYVEIFTFRKDVLFLPIDKKEVIEELKKDGIIQIIVKKGHYGFTDRDIPTIATPSILGVRADLPDEIVYSLLKGAFENIDLIQKSHSIMKNFTIEMAYKVPASFTDIVPFHPAAEKYFKEKLRH
jgi:TRAP transporter TAXI family solute receptor